MAVVGFRELQRGLRELGLTRESRVIAHASLSAFGPVRGGAEAVVGALISACGLVIMPAFTYQCMVWPLVGPPNNGVEYTGHDEENANAEIFRPDLPVHPSLGTVAETFRRIKDAVRSTHPLLSFTAVGPEAERAMAAQSVAEPLGPIAHLADADQGGDILLLGVDHTANTAIHYAEYRAGRRQFIRWGLTPAGTVECVAWPGDSRGFNAIASACESFTRVTEIGEARVERLPLNDLLRVAEELIHADPAALLCNHSDCERCGAVRENSAAPRQE